MVGTLIKTLLELLPASSYHPPYSVMIFGFGMLLGAADNYSNAAGELSVAMHESIVYWQTVDPHVSLSFRL